MKIPTLLLTVAATTLTLGCQDSFIQDGVTDSSQSVINLSRILPINHVIPLNATLANPGYGSRVVEVDGELIVSINEISRDCPWTSLNVGIQAQAALRPSKDKGPIWEIHGTTLDEVQFEVSTNLEKSYVLHGRRDGMTLHVRLSISREDITLDGMWLELSHESLPKDF